MDADNVLLKEKIYELTLLNLPGNVSYCKLEASVNCVVFIAVVLQPFLYYCNFELFGMILF